MIAPAVLISSCGPLLLSTTIRFGRIVDRVRVLSTRQEDLFHGRTDEAHVEDKMRAIDSQLDLLSRRARLLQRGMMMFYLALGAFIGSSFAIGVFAALGQKQDWVPVAVGLLGTLFLLYGSVLLIIESRLGVEAVTAELDFLRKLGCRREGSAFPRPAASAPRRGEAAGPVNPLM